MKKLLMVSYLLLVPFLGLRADNCDFACDPCDSCQWPTCEDGFFVGADWLYWKQEQSNMDVARLVDVTLDPFEPFVSHTDFLHPKNEYRNGFRVWGGYAFPCSCWDVSISYFNIPGHGSRNTIAPTENIDIILFDLFSFEPVILTSLDLKWNSNLQNIDVDIARTLTLCDNFKIRPHVGFRTVWMDQKYRFAGILPASPTPGETIVLNADVNEKFNGYGVEGGFWADWKLGCSGLSIVGHVGGSLLYSKFRVHQFAALGVLGVDGPVPFIEDTVNNHFFLGIPSMDYFAGLQYAAQLFGIEFKAHVGWEQHVFFDVNQLLNNSGNMYTQGLTLGLGARF